MAELYIPLCVPPEQRDQPALWFAFRRSDILVINGGKLPELPYCMDLSEHGLAAQRAQYLGLYGGRHCYAAAIGESQALPEGWSALGLRDLFGLVETTLAALSGRAYQLLEWERKHQYCSRCGTPTEPRKDERSRACPSCGYTTYQPVTPAIMILVVNGRNLLVERRTDCP